MSRKQRWGTNRARPVTRAGGDAPGDRGSRVTTRSTPYSQTTLPARNTKRISWTIPAILITAVLSFGISLGFVVSHSGVDQTAEAPGLPAARPAQTFEAVYRVDDTAGGGARVQTQILAVRRPDDVHVERREGPPPGGAVISGNIFTRASEILLGGHADGFTTARPPTILPELVSKPALDAAAGDGKAHWLGLATVIGERCTRYTYDQFGSDPFGEGGGQARIESCVTDDDIMLREIVAFEGVTVRRTEAVQVDRSPSFGPDEFSSSHPITPNAGSDNGDQATADQVTEGVPDDGVKALQVQVPSRFTLDRRGNVTHSLGPESPSVRYYAQSFTGGGEQIVVEQPLATEVGSPWTGRGGTKIDVGNGQPSLILYRTGYIEIETKVSDVPVRVLASRKDLATYVARQLRMST